VILHSPPPEFRPQWNFDESEVEIKWPAVIITGQKSLDRGMLMQIFLRHVNCLSIHWLGFSYHWGHKWRIV